ncbi:MAG: hypothetical protein R3B70_05595 [Polyangiaceae bacterium]
MHFRFDRLVKALLRKALSTLGEVGTEVEVAVDAQRIDVLFHPRPLNTRPLFDLGLLGRMAATPCLFEVFRDPPRVEQRRDALRKLLSWHHLELHPPAKRSPFA